MRLARAGIALDEQARCEQLLQVDQCRTAGTIESHVYLQSHAAPHGPFALA
jgi:hypothetical protein